MTDDELAKVYRALDSLIRADAMLQNGETQAESEIDAARMILLDLSNDPTKPPKPKSKSPYWVVYQDLLEEVRKARHLVMTPHPDIEKVAAHIHRIEALAEELADTMAVKGETTIEAKNV